MTNLFIITISRNHNKTQHSLITIHRKNVVLLINKYADLYRRRKKRAK